MDLDERFDALAILALKQSCERKNELAIRRKSRKTPQIKSLERWAGELEAVYEGVESKLARYLSGFLASFASRQT